MALSLILTYAQHQLDQRGVILRYNSIKSPSLLRGAFFVSPPLLFTPSSPSRLIASRLFCYFDFTKWIIGNFWPTKKWVLYLSLQRKSKKKQNMRALFWFFGIIWVERDCYIPYKVIHGKQQSHSQTIWKFTFFCIIIV